MKLREVFYVAKCLVRSFNSVCEVSSSLILESVDGDGQKSRQEVDFQDINRDSEADNYANSIIDLYPWTSIHKEHIVRVIKRVISQIDRNTAQKFNLRRVLSSHKLQLTHTAINRNGTTCLTGSYDRTAKVWDLEGGKCLATLSGHEDVVFDVAFAGHYEELISTGSFDKDIRVWRLSENSPVSCNSTSGFCEGILRKHKGPITVLRSFRTASSGPGLISASMDHSAIIWDLEMGDDLGSLIGHENSISGLVTSRSQDTLFTVSFDGTSRMWDAKTFKMIKLFQHDYCQVNSLALDWTDKILATGTTDSRAIIWDIRNCKKPACTVYRDAEVVHVAFDRAGRKLATASVDSCSSIIDVPTLSIRHNLRGHCGEITMVEFDASGTKVITTGEDGKVILWDAEDGRAVQVDGTHTKAIHSLKMSSAGNSFLTAGEDSKCCYWTTL